MESYLSPKEYTNKFHTDVTEFLLRYFKNLSSTHSRNVHKKIRNLFGQSTESRLLYDGLAKDLGILTSWVEVFLQTSVEISHNILEDQLRRIGQDNEKLWNWLREAQQEISKQRYASKDKEKKLSSKERIIKERDNTIKNSKKRIDTLVQEIDKVKSKAQDKVQPKPPGTRRSRTKKKGPIMEILILDDVRPPKINARDIFFYDVPGFCGEDSIVELLKKIGTVHKVSFRKQRKYQTVKARLSLHESYEESFNNKDFAVRVGENWWWRWYDGNSTTKERNDRDRWQMIRDLSVDEVSNIKNNPGGNGQATWCDALVNSHAEYGVAFAKIIKFGKLWKVLMYFREESGIMSFVRRHGLTNDGLPPWLFRTYQEFVKVTKDQQIRGPKRQPKQMVPPSNLKQQGDKGKDSLESLDFQFEVPEDSPDLQLNQFHKECIKPFEAEERYKARQEKIDAELREADWKKEYAEKSKNMYADLIAQAKKEKEE
jgi:hypothetical protein